MIIFSILRLLVSILCTSYVRAFVTQTANLPHTKQQHTKISFNEVSIEDGKDINSDDHQTIATTIGERIRCGDSLIQLANLATSDECKLLVNRCIRYANNITPTRQLDKPGLVRIPTIDAYNRAQLSNTVCSKPLPSDVDDILQNILSRAISYVDDELPSLSTTLFNTNSISTLLQNNQLKYSSREPAINIYTTGGQFLAHKDAQSLTILLPLSPPTDFTGGGTAFWTQDSRGHRVEEPSIIQKPKYCGTALLFGGCVTHSGVAVESGERVVFVASFSSSKEGSSSVDQTMEEQRDIYGDSL